MFNDYSVFQMMKLRQEEIEGMHGTPGSVTFIYLK